MGKSVGMRRTLYKSIKVTERGGISVDPLEVLRSKSFRDYYKRQGYKKVFFEGKEIKLTD